MVLALTCSWGIFYQVLFIWMPTYLSQVQHFSEKAALQLNCFYLILFACCILCAGYFADRMNRKLILQFACIAMLVASYPLFILLASGQLWQAYLAMGIFTFIFSIYLPIAFITMIELFSVQVRYTLLSFGFNIGLAIFGGTCPLVITWLIEITQNSISPAFYMMAAALISLFACISIAPAPALLEHDAPN